MTTTNGTTSSTLITDLANVQKQLIRSLAVPLALGLVGNIASCLVFSQKQFRANAISLLFTAAAIFNIVVLVYGIGTSFYSLGHTSPETYSLVFCKLRLYIRHIFLMIVRTYITLACMASYALSSLETRIRFLFHWRYVKRIVLIVPFLWPLIALHMPFFTTIRRQQCVNDDDYVLPFAVYFFLIVGVLPVLLMVVFIALTIRNLHLLHRRMQLSVIQSSKLKSRDRQFIRMLSALVLMYAFTNLFYPANVLYSAVTYWTEKSAERAAIESIVFSVTSNYVLYINNVSPFFLFVGSSAAFRQSFYRLVSRYTPFTMRHRSRIQPIRVTAILTEPNRL